jgi:hypothetical protein
MKKVLSLSILAMLLGFSYSTQPQQQTTVTSDVAINAIVSNPYEE